MKNPTTHYFNALLHRVDRRARWFTALLVTWTLVILVAAPDDAGGRSSADDRGRERRARPAATVGTPAPPAPVIERDGAIDESEPPGRAQDTAFTVPDPRPGDLRSSAEADVLPVGFEAEPAHRIIRDISYGPDASHLIDVHLPDRLDAPVIVFLHAGGWVAGTRQDVPDLVLRHIERGYAIASVEYRLAPDHPFPAPVHDVKRAIRELKVFAENGDLIDADQLVLYGASAGGHLAAFVAATAGHHEPADLTAAQRRHDSTVAGIVVAVGPTDLEQLYEHPHAWAGPLAGAHVGCDPCRGDDLRTASVAPHLHDDLPPAYWAYGARDALVDAEHQGRTIADAWAAAAGPARSWFDLVESQGHNLDGSTVNERWIERFIDAVAKGVDPPP